MTTTTLAPLRAPAPPRLHVVTLRAGCGHMVRILGCRALDGRRVTACDRCNGPKGVDMDRITGKLFALKINQLFEERFFSICGFDALVKVAGIIVDADIYKRLHLLHCVPYEQMDREVRQWLYQAVLDSLQAPVDFPKLNTTLPAFDVGDFAVRRPMGMAERVLAAVGVRK